jgi:hypothetical protein
LFYKYFFVLFVSFVVNKQRSGTYP